MSISIKDTFEKLDKYYTKSEVASLCIDEMLTTIVSIYESGNLIFIEPSAGSGVFLNQLDAHGLESIGFDIHPTADRVIKNDFLKNDLKKYLKGYKNHIKIIIGNPPFGFKSKLAIDFLNKSFGYSDLVGFIIPIQFRKWSVQSKINKDAKLISDITLPEKAFEFMGKDYGVRCCFQIWTTLDTNLPNTRITDKPITAHPDFEMWQYNRTEEAEKFFDFDWDFAVPRQGFNDYSFKAFKKEECDRKKQWIFFKAKDEVVLQKLLSLDFVSLSKQNIGIPGFGKADVIKFFNSTL